MSKILTISVAGYNVENYIDSLLESVVKSKYIDDIEVLVIDDGGNDRTIDIAQNYAKQYPNSIIPIHKTNGGWGSTVNTAITKGTGKYIKLLDGDDYFNTKGLDNLVEKMKTIDSDIIYSPRIDFDDISGKILGEAGLKLDCPINSEKDITILTGDLGLSMHVCAFKLANFQKNKISILEKCFYTDFEYLVKGLGCSETVYFTNIPVYMYRLGREGQSVSLTGRRKHYKDQFKVLNALLEYNKKIKCNDNKHKILNSYISLYIDNTLIAITQLGERQDACKLYKKIKIEHKNVYKPIRKKAKSYIFLKFLQAIFYSKNR